MRCDVVRTALGPYREPRETDRNHGINIVNRRSTFFSGVSVTRFTPSSKRSFMCCPTKMPQLNNEKKRKKKKRVIYPSLRSSNPVTRDCVPPTPKESSYSLINKRGKGMIPQLKGEGVSERVSAQSRSSSSVSLFARFFRVRQTKPPLIRLIVRKPSAAG